MEDTIKSAASQDVLSSNNPQHTQMQPSLRSTSGTDSTVSDSTQTLTSRSTNTFASSSTAPSLTSKPQLHSPQPSTSTITPSIKTSNASLLPHSHSISSPPSSQQLPPRYTSEIYPSTHHHQNQMPTYVPRSNIQAPKAFYSIRGDSTSNFHDAFVEDEEDDPSAYARRGNTSKDANGHIRHRRMCCGVPMGRYLIVVAFVLVIMLAVIVAAIVGARYH